MGTLEDTIVKAQESKAKQAERERVRNEELLAKFESALVEVVGHELREDQKLASRRLATFVMNEMLTHWIDVWDDSGNGIDSGDLINKIDAMIKLVKQA
jgi:hypothetical protein